jgi:hypothetical protein
MSLSRTRGIESYNTCAENNKKCNTSEAIGSNNEATVRQYHKVRTWTRTETEQRADSCLISVTSVDNTEAWVNDYVITSRSSLDLLVPNKLLGRGCATEWGSLQTMPVLPDSECGMGCAWLQCNSGRTQDHPQQDGPQLGRW